VQLLESMDLSSDSYQLVNK